MNKYLLTILIIITTLEITAQEFEMLEPLHKKELSANYSRVFATLDNKISEDQTLYGKPAPGYGINLMYTGIINRFFSFQTGIIYHSMKYELVGDQKIHYNIQLDRINIPILFTLNSDICKIINYSLFAGPQMSRTINSNFENFNFPNNTHRDTSQTILSVNNDDYGIAYGASADIAINKSRTIRIEIGGRGSFGFANIAGSVEDESNQENILANNTTIKTFGGYMGLKFAF